MLIKVRVKLIEYVCCCDIDNSLFCDVGNIRLSIKVSFSDVITLLKNSNVVNTSVFDGNT